MTRFGLAIATVVASFIVPLGNIQTAAAFYDARGNTRAEFRGLWEQRLQTYEDQRAPLAKAHKDSVAPFLDPRFKLTGPDGIVAMYRAALDESRNLGRGALLYSFLERQKTKASVVILRTWLQGEVDQQRLKEERSASLDAAAKALTESPTATVGQFLAAAEMAAMAKGDAIGHGEELSLLIDNFSSFAEAMAEADARDAEMKRRIGAALAAFGRGLQQPPGWTATCVQTGTITNCSGR